MCVCVCVCVCVCKWRERAKDSSSTNLFVLFEVMLYDYTFVAPWIKSIWYLSSYLVLRDKITMMSL